MRLVVETPRRVLPGEQLHGRSGIRDVPQLVGQLDGLARVGEGADVVAQELGPPVGAHRERRHQNSERTPVAGHPHPAFDPRDLLEVPQPADAEHHVDQQAGVVPQGRVGLHLCQRAVQGRPAVLRAVRMHLRGAVHPGAERALEWPAVLGHGPHPLGGLGQAGNIAEPMLREGQLPVRPRPRAPRGHVDGLAQQVPGGVHRAGVLFQHGQDVQRLAAGGRRRVLPQHAGRQLPRVVDVPAHECVGDGRRQPIGGGSTRALGESTDELVTRIEPCS